MPQMTQSLAKSSVSSRIHPKVNLEMYVSKFYFTYNTQVTPAQIRKPKAPYVMDCEFVDTHEKWKISKYEPVTLFCFPVVAIKN